MADFVQTMKDWRRMCNAQDDGSDRDVCKTCPMGNGGCSAVYEDDGSMNYAHVEKVVTKWSAEHPEPVYPTWRDWLETQYHQTRKAVDCGHESLNSWMNNTPIPADIAQKLGIEPKGET